LTLIGFCTQIQILDGLVLQETASIPVFGETVGVDAAIGGAIAGGLVEIGGGIIWPGGVVKGMVM